MPYVVTVNNKNIVTLIQVTDGAHWTHDKAKQIENVARNIAPRRTGRLSASHVTLPTRGSNQYQKVYRVSALAPYAGYVHGGTGIHGPEHRPITSRTGRMLKLPFSAYSTGATPKMRVLEKGRERGVSTGYRGKLVRGSIYVHSVQGQKAQPWMSEAARLVLGAT